MIIGFVSQKGGVGKSTLAQAVAREAAAGGLSVKIADLDMLQKTSVDWTCRRLEAGLEPVVPVEPFGTAAHAIKSAEHYDVLVLDGPARADQGTLEIARMADLIVQPAGPSLADLRPAVAVFHKLVKSGVDPSKLVVALCRIGSEAEERSARDYVQRAGYEVLAGALYERPAYRQAQDAGLAVTETKYAGLSQRADALIQSLFDKLNQE
jgi:chromosome partitioning protein